MKKRKKTIKFFKEKGVEEGKFYKIVFKERYSRKNSVFYDKLEKIHLNYYPIHFWFKSRMFLPEDRIVSMKRVTKKEYDRKIQDERTE